MTLIDEEDRKFEIINDGATKYDWNEGGGGFRELFIKVNSLVSLIVWTSLMSVRCVELI